MMGFKGRLSPNPTLMLVAWPVFSAPLPCRSTYREFCAVGSSQLHITLLQAISLPCFCFCLPLGLEESSVKQSWLNPHVHAARCSGGAALSAHTLGSVSSSLLQPFRSGSCGCLRFTRLRFRSCSWGFLWSNDPKELSDISNICRVQFKIWSNTFLLF